MWEVLKTNPLGRLSMRNLLFVATTLIVAILANLTVLSHHTAAISDATWKDNVITYDDKQFSLAPSDQPAPTTAAPKDASAVYFYMISISDQQTIFFKKGVDPKTATQAEFFVEPDVKDAKTISITPDPNAPPLTGASSDSSGKCNVSQIGWIVCPISDKLSASVDYLYGIIAGFLKVAPLTGSAGGVIYKGWSYMRNIANIAFVIAFLIIIYSQITNIGLSSYGMKKLLPRVIAAAILMNLSYWICALAVDLSNIFGYSLQDVFINIRKGMMAGATVQTPSWGGITAAVLGGGGATVVGGAVIAASSGGALALLVPILIGVALSALIAIIILAARQAIITIFIIISPLAFVAFLLPNTDKYFKKWRETFTTLLVMFPIFSVLFGGAQLAGSAIILTAHGSIVELIFGLAVQVIPLAITPLILKFSGSLLSQVAGVVNNPKKGVVDRSRNWANGVNERQTARGIAAGNKYARYRDHKKRERDGKHKNVQARNDNIYTGSKVGQAIKTDEHDIANAAKQIEASHEVHLNARLDPKNTHFDRRIFEKELELKRTQNEGSYRKDIFDRNYSEISSGDRSAAPLRMGPMTEAQSKADLYNRVQDLSTNIAAEGMSKQIAERAQQAQIAKELTANTFTTDNGQLILERAGGVLGKVGETSAEASAKKISSKHMIEDIDNIESTMKYEDAKNNERLEILFNSTSNMAQRVAYAKIMGKNGAPGIGKLKEVITNYENSGVNNSDLNDFKELVATAPAIMSAGKDLEFWLTKSKDDAGQDRSFTSLTNDLKTWTNLSATAFANQNAATHYHALDLLHASDRASYDKIIGSLRTNPAALGSIKQQVREKYTIYSDAELASMQAQGIAVGAPGTVRP